MKLKLLSTFFILFIVFVGTISADNYKSTTVLNVRQGPSEDYKVVFKLKKGDEVVLIKKYDEDWYEIEHNGKKGYVYKEYLTLAGINKTIDRNLSYKGLSVKEIGYIALGVIILAIMLVVIISSLGKNKYVPQQNIETGGVQTTSYSRAPRYNEIRSTKSVALAVMLVVLFGPLGMFYSTIKGALFMTFVAPILFGALFFIGFSSPEFFVLLVIGLLIYYPICLIWSGRAANSYNQRINRERLRF